MRPINLVPHHVSADAVAAAEYILAETKAGRFNGLAYIGLCPGREYVIDLAGEALAQPLFTHSLVALLAYELIRIHRNNSRS
jgi:hypothetical protein